MRKKIKNSDYSGKPTKAQLRIAQCMGDLSRGLAETLEEIAGEEMAFCLMVFGEKKGCPTEGIAAYAANFKRDDVMRELEKLIAAYKKQILIPINEVNETSH